MKKIVLGMMMAVMFLAGCGVTADGADGNLQTVSADMTSGSEESNATQEVETQPETEGPVRVEFSHDKIYMSLELPVGWEYEIKEYNAEKEGETCGIIFGPEEHEDLRYELFYHSFYGICGTGVTIEQLQLKNGMDIHKYSEKINDTLWCDIVFAYEKEAAEKGDYVLGYYAKKELAEEFDEELGEILETIVVGKK
ncbi:MAG: hypothetical protein NC086_01125 [Alistipes sp.]|nr:hypothetical protein [Alistipes sp.]